MVWGELWLLTYQPIHFPEILLAYSIKNFRDTSSTILSTHNNQRWLWKITGTPAMCLPLPLIMRVASPKFFMLRAVRDWSIIERSKSSLYAALIGYQPTCRTYYYRPTIALEYDKLTVEFHPPMSFWGIGLFSRVAFTCEGMRIIKF